MTAQLSFFARLGLAFTVAIRIAFDAAFGSRARLLLDPAPAPTPTSTPGALTREAPALAPTPAREESALLLLALLQREGRLVDFVEQEIATFSDADVGAAARVVHDGCRRALHAHASLAPVRGEEEGARVQVDEGFAPEEIKLTGNVTGAAPFRGVLRHKGWRVDRFTLPETVKAYDTRVVAPAEVEL